MKPSEVRETVLREHLALRGILSRVESLAHLVAGDEPWRVGDLRAAAFFDAQIPGFHGGIAPQYMQDNLAEDEPYQGAALFGD